MHSWSAIFVKFTEFWDTVQRIESLSTVSPPEGNKLFSISSV